MSQDISQAALAPAANGHDANGAGHAGGNFWILALGSVGVVFGDIGTSPLYALQAALSQFKRGGLTVEAVVGVVSLIIWALLIVVTAKYVLFLMQADNKGEGGILSLMALAQVALGRKAVVAFALGVAGRRCFPATRSSPRRSRCSPPSRASSRSTPTSRLRPAGDRRHPDPAVSRPATRHRRRGGVLRPDHGGVLHHQRRARRDAHSRRVGDPARAQPRAGPGVPVAARRARLRRARQRLPRRDRRGGALRRHGPFRPPADPGRVAVPRPAGADGQLSRSGRR